MADGLPALGIVAAVLGVIKTMGSITEPPGRQPGGMIGSALVGLLSGRVLWPMASSARWGVRLRAVIDEDATVLSTSFATFWWRICMVTQRKCRWRSACSSVPSEDQPSFQELENSLNNDSAGRRLMPFYFTTLTGTSRSL